MPAPVGELRLGLFQIRLTVQGFRSDLPRESVFCGFLKCYLQLTILILSISKGLQFEEYQILCEFMYIKSLKPLISMLVTSCCEVGQEGLWVGFFFRD